MPIRHSFLQRPQAVAIAAALVAALALASCAPSIPSVPTRAAAAPSPTATSVLPARTPSATARVATVTPTRQPTASPTVTETVQGLRYVSADGDGLFIRSKPDMDAKVKVWPDGAVVELLSQQGEWCRVRAPDGYVGYMPTRYLSATPPGPVATPTWRAAAAAVMYVSADGDGVYIRSRPDRAAKVKVWPDGSRMTVLGQQGEWCYVRDPDGYFGYMPAEYLSATMP